MTDQAKFPDKLYCNLIPDNPDGDVYTYLSLEAAAEGDAPVKVGIYTLTEVVEARLIQTIETTKVVE